MSNSDLCELFAYHLRVLDLPPATREYMFAKEDLNRNWRADFAWPEKKILVEIEGGTWIRGRHTRGLGFENDCRKYNAAAELGYKVFRFTGNMLHSGEFIAVLERILKNEL